MRYSPSPATATNASSAPGRWSVRGATRGAPSSRGSDYLLWELPAAGEGALIGLYCSTEHLTAGRLHLRPGGRTGVRTHRGDLVLHVLTGPLHVLLPDADGPGGPRWFELGPGDGFFVPGGRGYEVRKITASELHALFAVAPED